MWLAETSLQWFFKHYLAVLHWCSRFRGRIKKSKYYLGLLSIYRPQPNLLSGDTSLGSEGVPWIEVPLHRIGVSCLSTSNGPYACCWRQKSGFHHQAWNENFSFLNSLETYRFKQGRSQDFSKGGGSQRLLTAALPRVSAGSVVLSRHEGPY